MINNRFIHFETQAQYLAKINDISPDAIVFVDEGRKIYTHGEEYGGDSIDITNIYNKFEQLEALYNQMIGNIGSDDIDAVNPTVGQILMYSATGKWVNVSPQALKNTFVTVGTQTQNDDQAIYGEKTFYDDARFKGDVVATRLINSVYGNLENGSDYILCADGSVKYIYDIIKANPGTEGGTHRVVVSSGNESENVSWKAVGIDSQFVNGLHVYTVVDGGQLQLEFSAQTGYEIDRIVVGNQYIDVLDSYTLRDITKDTVVQVFAKPTSGYQPGTHSLVINAQNASWKVSGVDTDFVTTNVYSISDGSTTTVTFKADDGYRIDYINATGSTATVGTNYATFPALLEDSIVTAVTSLETEAVKRIVKVQCGSYGNVEGHSYKEYEVEDGGSLSILFTPHEGYEIDRIRVNGTDLDTIVNPLVLTDINKTTDVYVLFKPEAGTPVTRYVGINCGSNGYVVYNGRMVSPNTYSSFEVTSGNPFTIEAVPSNGYEVDTIKATNVNGTTIASTSSNTLTLPNVDQNTNIIVTFKQSESTPTTNDRTVTIDGDDNITYNVDGYDANSYFVSGTNVYENIPSGSQLDIYVIPAKGYEIDTVKQGSSTISPINAETGLYRVTITADSTITIKAKQSAANPTGGMYYGFAENSIDNTTGLSAIQDKSTIAGQYASTSEGNLNYWYIVFPNEWNETPYVEIKNGFGDVTMTALSDMTINSISYKVYRTDLPLGSGDYTFIVTNKNN